MAPSLLFASDSLSGILRLLQGEDISQQQRKAIYSAIYASQRPTVRWASPRPGVHVIDDQTLNTVLMGMEAAFCAVGAPGRHLVRAADFAAPGAGHPDIAVRAALGRAAAFLRLIHAGLANAVASIKVEGGFVVYRPSGAIDIEVIAPAER